MNSTTHPMVAICHESGCRAASFTSCSEIARFILISLILPGKPVRTSPAPPDLARPGAGRGISGLGLAIGTDPPPVATGAVLRAQRMFEHPHQFLADTAMDADTAPPSHPGYPGPEHGTTGRCLTVYRHLAMTHTSRSGPRPQATQGRHSDEPAADRGWLNNRQAHHAPLTCRKSSVTHS